MSNKKSYKDYKYTYTGYKDYCKDHSIKIENKPVKKKNINHDHRFKFDFNNPTQHNHDYSFDFNNPNEHYHDYSFDFSENPQPKNATANKKTYYTNTYKNTSTSSIAKSMSTTAKTTSPTTKTTTAYTSNNRYGSQTNNQYTPINTYINQTKQTNQAAKTIKWFFILMFVVPVAISFLSNIFELIYYNSYDYGDNYDYEVNINYEDIDENEYYYDTYTNATTSFCNALLKGNLDYMSDRISYEEMLDKKGSYWQSIINKYPTYYRNTITCSPVVNYTLTSTERTDLQEEFYDEYYENIKLTEAKNITIYVYYYGYNNYKYTKQHNIVVGRINNKWYFINTKDTEY